MVHAPSFPERSRSVATGSPFGPFAGQVLDADSQTPIAGAVVSASWHFQRGVGNSAPEARRVQETTTDVDGRYRVPSLRDLPSGMSTRLSNLTVVVYKKGYAAYRHDRSFTAGGTRHSNFAQLDAQVALSRWSPELSRARHLLFIGSSPAVRKASAWEVLAAAAELDGTGKAASGLTSGGTGIAPLARNTPFMLNASKLLTSDEIRAITGYTGAFKVGRLKEPRSEVKDSLHFRADGKPERYDVAIRIWRASGDPLSTRYEELLNALPNSKQVDEVGDRSFTVVQGEILGLGLMDRADSTLVLLTCGRGQCVKDEMLLTLGKKIQEHLHRLPAYSAEEKEASSEGEGGAEDEDEK
jgi:hypothetical protein